MVESVPSINYASRQVSDFFSLNDHIEHKLYPFQYTFDASLKSSWLLTINTLTPSASGNPNHISNM